MYALSFLRPPRTIRSIRCRLVPPYCHIHLCRMCVLCDHVHFQLEHEYTSTPLCVVWELEVYLQREHVNVPAVSGPPNVPLLRRARKDKIRGDSLYVRYCPYRKSHTDRRKLCSSLLC
jgi:REP element-mobilizing transposase RayT